MATVPLKDLAAVIRSKNAGPFELTFDIMFDNEAAYRRVLDAGVITPELVVRLFRMDPADLLCLEAYDAARAIKITIVRPWEQGTFGDMDALGCQQASPLFDVEIPV